MRRSVALTALALAVVALLVQLLLPGYLAGRVERRLEQDGGTAKVSLGAFPAPRLLFEDGDRIEVRGSGIRTELRPAREKLDKLDGFDEVDVQLTDVRTGPFEVERLELSRAPSEPDYRVALSAAVSGRDLATYAGSRFGGPLGALFGGIAGGALPLGSSLVPVRIDGRVASDEDGLRLVAGNATVAGLPTGPLAEVILGAIVSRL